MVEFNDTEKMLKTVLNKMKRELSIEGRKQDPYFKPSKKVFLALKRFGYYQQKCELPNYEVTVFMFTMASELRLLRMEVGKRRFAAFYCRYIEGITQEMLTFRFGGSADRHAREAFERFILMLYPEEVLHNMLFL